MAKSIAASIAKTPAVKWRSLATVAIPAARFRRSSPTVVTRRPRLCAPRCHKLPASSRAVRIVFLLRDRDLSPFKPARPSRDQRERFPSCSEAAQGRSGPLLKLAAQRRLWRPHYGSFWPRRGPQRPCAAPQYEKPASVRPRQVPLRRFCRDRSLWSRLGKWRGSFPFHPAPSGASLNRDGEGAASHRAPGASL